MTTRRQLLQGLAAVGLLGQHGLSFAASPQLGERRLIVVLLRGGMDGLAAVPPYGDPDYLRARGEIAFDASEGGDSPYSPLNDTFGLHSALAPWLPLYSAGELAIVHAAGLPLLGRSHFDAQDLLECGANTPKGAHSGWLNRALGSAPCSATAIGAAIPLLLQGPQAVTALDPIGEAPASEELLERLAGLYAADPTLLHALQGADEARGMGLPEGEARKLKAKGVDRARFIATGSLLAKAEGPRVAVIEVGGWDTHAGQGVRKGRLARQLSALADATLGLREAMGLVWSQTVVVMATEFGRMVKGNGTGGTDHGTAGAAFVLGGRVKGGRVLADWPGLSASRLADGRDLALTTDLRALFKGLLHEHLAIDRKALDQQIFPDSAAIKPLTGLLRA